MTKAIPRFDETEAEIKFRQGLQKLAQSKDGVSLEIPIKHITLDDNIRDAIDTESPEFKQLVESIKEIGLLQSPVITVDLDQGKILCLGGHRRILAMQQLKHDVVKVIYRNIEERHDHKLAQLVENVARQNLQPLELASALGQIRESEKYSASRLAELMGRERKYVERLLKIDRWPTEAKNIARANPEKANLKKLFAIAGRKLSDDQITAAVKELITPVRKGAEATAQRTPNTSKMTESSLKHYLSEANFSKKEREAILRFVSDMGLLRSPEKKMGHGAPSSPNP